MEERMGKALEILQELQRDENIGKTIELYTESDKKCLVAIRGKFMDAYIRRGDVKVAIGHAEDFRSGKIKYRSGPIHIPLILNNYKYHFV